MKTKTINIEDLAIGDKMRNPYFVGEVTFIRWYPDHPQNMGYVILDDGISQNYSGAIYKGMTIEILEE